PLLITAGAIAMAGAAQAAPARQASATAIVGHETSGKLDIKTRTTTTDTFTLTFAPAGSATTFDVSFIAQYASQGPRSAPSVVDIVVTEHQAQDTSPTL